MVVTTLKDTKKLQSDINYFYYLLVIVIKIYYGLLDKRTDSIYF